MQKVSESLFLIDHDWNHAYEALVSFRASGLSDKDIDIDTTHDGISIGLWCRLQCKLKETDRLAQSRIEMLEKIGFDFNMISVARSKPEILNKSPAEKEEIWNEFYRCLVKFINLYKRAPASNEELDGKSIGSWLNTQRYRWHKLNPDKIKKLQDLPVPIETSSDTKWRRYYEAVLQYHDEFNSLPDASLTHKGLRLGHWINRQRINYRNKDLSSEQVELLLAAGIISKVMETAA